MRPKGRPAEVFPLCEYLRDELEARGWAVADLAGRCAVSRERLDVLLSDPHAFLALREAEALGHAFGVTPTLFLGLQLAWRKYHKGGP